MELLPHKSHIHKRRTLFLFPKINLSHQIGHPIRLKPGKPTLNDLERIVALGVDLAAPPSATSWPVPRLRAPFKVR